MSGITGELDCIHQWLATHGLFSTIERRVEPGWVGKAITYEIYEEDEEIHTRILNTSSEYYWQRREDLQWMITSIVCRQCWGCSGYVLAEGAIELFSLTRSQAVGRICSLCHQALFLGQVPQHVIDVLSLDFQGRRGHWRFDHGEGPQEEWTVPHLVLTLCEGAREVDLCEEGDQEGFEEWCYEHHGHTDNAVDINIYQEMHAMRDWLREILGESYTSLLVCLCATHCN